MSTVTEQVKKYRSKRTAPGKTSEKAAMVYGDSISDPDDSGAPLKTTFWLLCGSKALTMRFENPAIHPVFRNFQTTVRTKSLAQNLKN